MTDTLIQCVHSGTHVATVNVAEVQLMCLISDITDKCSVLNIYQEYLFKTNAIKTIRCFACIDKYFWSDFFFHIYRYANGCCINAAV